MGKKVLFQMFLIESITAGNRANGWAAVMLFGVALVCAVGAIGELVAHFVLGLGTVHPLGAIGFSALLALAAVVCLIGAWKLKNIHKRMKHTTRMIRDDRV